MLIAQTWQCMLLTLTSVCKTLGNGVIAITSNCLVQAKLSRESFYFIQLLPDKCSKFLKYLDTYYSYKCLLLLTQTTYNRYSQYSLC